MGFVPLRWKVLGAFLSLLLAVLGASLFLVDRYQRKQADSELRHQLALTHDVLNSSLQVRAQNLTVALGLLAGDFAFKQAFATNDSGTIASAAENFRSRIGAALVMACDEEGVVRADTSKTRMPGASARELPVIARAELGESASMTQVLGGRLLLLSAVPLLAADEVIGVVVAGFELDSAYAEVLKKLTMSDVTFLAGGAVSASTLDGADRAALEAALPGLPARQARLVGRSPRRWITLAAPVQGDVIAVVQRSWEGALEPLELLETLLVLIGLVAAALTTLAGLLIARQVTSPVGRLAAAARRIREGDYAARVEIGQRDELGQLGGAFNEMAGGLEERERIRAELERSLLIRMNLAKFVPQGARTLIEKDPQADLLGKKETDVTVLFADIAGYTRLSARMDPARLSALVEKYFGAFFDEIIRRGGDINETAGDGLMVIFHSGEHPQAALDAAQAIQRRTQELNREGAGQHEPLSIHVGLNSGPALLGATKIEGSAGTRWTYTASGMTTNLAARVAAQAEAGDVVLNEATLARVKPDVPTEDMGLRELKNVDKPMRLFRIRSRAAPAAQ